MTTLFLASKPSDDKKKNFSVLRCCIGKKNAKLYVNYITLYYCILCFILFSSLPYTTLHYKHFTRPCTRVNILSVSVDDIFKDF